MDGIHQFTTPLPLSFTLDGKEWQLSPINFGDYGEIERRAINSKPHPLEEAKRVLSALSEENAKSLVEAAWRESVKMRALAPGEMAAFLNGPDGDSLLLWLSLRKRHPDLTEDQCRQMLSVLDRTQYGKLAELVSEVTNGAKN